MTRVNPIRLVSWDIDGTLYSIRRMKWHLTRMFLSETAPWPTLLAGKELAALRRYRSRINAARSAGGALTEFFLEQNCREALLEMEKRWYGPAIEKTGLRRRRLQCHFVFGGERYSAGCVFRL